MADRVRVAVVGSGYFGRFHANHYARNDRADLVAIVDSDAERARAVAAEFGGEAVTDAGDGSRRLVAIDGDANHLRSGVRQRRDLRRGRRDVGRIGVRHGLDDDRMPAADPYAADFDGHGLAPQPPRIAHGSSWISGPFAPS